MWKSATNAVNSCIKTPWILVHMATHTSLLSLCHRWPVVLMAIWSFFPPCMSLKLVFQEHIVPTLELCSGLPWWLSGKESTYQCRKQRFDSWAGKVPSAAGLAKQLCHPLCPCALEPVLCMKRNHCSEKSMNHYQKGAPTHHHERNLFQQQRPSIAKYMNLKEKKEPSAFSHRRNIWMVNSLTEFAYPHCDPWVCHLEMQNHRSLPSQAYWIRICYLTRPPGDSTCT